MENQAEQNNNMESQKKLIDLLKELAAIQADNAKLSFAIHSREIKDKVSKKIGDIKKSIQEKARGFGGKAQRLAKDYVEGQKGAEEVKDLEAQIEELGKGYQDGYKVILDERAQLETEEQQIMLDLADVKQDRKQALIARRPVVEQFNELQGQREEIMRKMQEAIQNADSKGMQEASKAFARTDNQYKRLKQQKEQADREVEELTEEIERIQRALIVIRTKLEASSQKEQQYIKDNSHVLESIFELEEQRDTTKSLIPKQNLFQKIAGAIVNKVNGASKFTKEVIGKVKKETVRIATEEIPKVKKDVTEKVTGTIGQIVSKARDIKNNNILKAQNKLDQKRQRHVELEKKRQEQLGIVIEEEQTTGGPILLEGGKKTDSPVVEDGEIEQ